MENLKKFPAGNWQDQVWVLERWFCWPLVDSMEARRTGKEEKDPLTVQIIKSEPEGLNCLNCQGL